MSQNSGSQVSLLNPPSVWLTDGGNAQCCAHPTSMAICLFTQMAKEVLKGGENGKIFGFDGAN